MNLEQEDTHEYFLAMGSGLWTVISESWWVDGSHHGGTYSALVPPSQVERASKSAGWDIFKWGHGPGFSQGADENGQWCTTYYSGIDRADIQPLVLFRDFAGVLPSYVEIEQEFRLFHDLHQNQDGQLQKVQDDGETEVVVKIEGQKVSVRTKALRQYMAARQLSLALYIDSARYGQDGESLPDNAKWRGDSYAIDRDSAEVSGRLLTRYIGSRIISPPPIEKSGVWPFENTASFIDFIIDVDADGDLVEHSCDPDSLADYFGKNPDEPHYLTPVFFRKDVLQRYYNKPGLYTVSDGRIQCKSLWIFQIDNSLEDAVMAFLGDLGRDLPEADRSYWRSFNIAPDGRPSDTLIRRAFLAQFADPASLDLQLRQAYRALGSTWSDYFKWDLYRAPVGVDAGLLERLRVPLDEDQVEFENSIRVLTQLFVDAINENAIQKDLPDKKENEKGIAKLARWLEQEDYPEATRDIKFLRELQDVRSTATAHRKSSDYEKRLTAVFGGARGGAAVSQFFERALAMARTLRKWVEERQECGHRDQ